MAKGTCSEETLRASSKQDEANSGRGLVVVRVGIAAAADSSVNRCLESDGAWHHITAPAHPPPPRIACRVKRVLIDCRRGGPPSRNRHTLSQPVLCSRLAATDTPAQDFLTSTPLTLPHTSLVCAFAASLSLHLSPQRECPRRREARYKAGPSRRSRHRMHLLRLVASLRG
jgi:hypothetical protein